MYVGWHVHVERSIAYFVAIWFYLRSNFWRVLRLFGLNEFYTFWCNFRKIVFWRLLNLLHCSVILKHVCIWDNACNYKFWLPLEFYWVIPSHFARTAWWNQWDLLGYCIVHTVPCTCCFFFGQIPLGIDPGRIESRLQRGPLSVSSRKHFRGLRGKGFPTDSRHYNWHKLCPSPSRHIFVLIQSGIHTGFALNWKEKK